MRDAMGERAQRTYAEASNTGADDSFGYDVAPSDDGDTPAVVALPEESDSC